MSHFREKQINGHNSIIKFNSSFDIIVYIKKTKQIKNKLPCKSKKNKYRQI